MYVFLKISTATTAITIIYQAFALFKECFCTLHVSSHSIPSTTHELDEEVQMRKEANLPGVPYVYVVSSDTRIQIGADISYTFSVMFESIISFSYSFLSFISP